MADLKPVYQAVSKEQAEYQLNQLDEKWGKKYPVVIDPWCRNWGKLTTYFQYSEAIRRLICTTNIIEGFHCQVCKVTKSKGAFTSDMALLKLIYLAARSIRKKLTRPLQNCSLVVSQLLIIFGDHLKLQL
ncbi:transposase [Chitinophaga qingshengii]|uniref:Mutator family transposase n=1 Tax=Chitinophaga qingshengii TaxID=1569794 RepID=A0ABR7TL82_9BACT|nr:transposase [Chitinophaga qingshengii]MBC9930298.1 transposase [Chitinophaga qingshengii]